jgi:cytidylate kinase
MIVAIDGPAGTGKSTIARMLADRMGYVYVNSGNLYRALTYGILESGWIPPWNPRPLIGPGRRIWIIGREVHLNGLDVEPFLRSDTVEKWVAQVSAFVPLRHMVNDVIRAISRRMNIVVEGRDMTTTVFPDAEYKVYLDASPESPSSKTIFQGTSALSLQEIRENIEMRDRIDREKKEGPLKVAPDATYLDTSYLTIEEVYEKVYTKILQQGILWV